jgi:hypothetical protein
MWGAGVQFECKILTLTTYSAKRVRFLDGEGGIMVISGVKQDTRGVRKVNLMYYTYFLMCMFFFIFLFDFNLTLPLFSLLKDNFNTSR